MHEQHLVMDHHPLFYVSGVTSRKTLTYKVDVPEYTMLLHELGQELVRFHEDQSDQPEQAECLNRMLR